MTQIRDLVADLLRDKAMLKTDDGHGQFDNQQQGPSNGSLPAPFAGALAFHPRYAGWKIRQARATNDESRVGKSWKTPEMTRLTFSNEDLFLQAVGLRAKYVKKGLSHLSVYDNLRKTQRAAVDTLRHQQNQLLQRINRRLEWELAGLKLRTRRSNSHPSETISILVILKTEIRLPLGNEPNTPAAQGIASHLPALPVAMDISSAMPLRAGASTRSREKEAEHSQSGRANTGIRLERSRQQEYEEMRVGSGSRDRQMTVEEEDAMIESWLREWDEMMDIPPTRRATSPSRWSVGITTGRLKPVGISRKSSRNLATDCFQFVRHSRSVAGIEYVGD